MIMGDDQQNEKAAGAHDTPMVESRRIEQSGKM
jgi:hypothetical protein